MSSPTKKLIILFAPHPKKTNTDGLQASHAARPLSALSSLSADHSLTVVSQDEDETSSSELSLSQDHIEKNTQLRGADHRTTALTSAQSTRAQTSDVLAPIPKAPGSEAGWGDNHCTPLTCSPISSPDTSFIGAKSRGNDADTLAGRGHASPSAASAKTAGVKSDRNHDAAGGEHVALYVASEGDRDVLLRDATRRAGHGNRTQVDNSTHALSVDVSVVSASRSEAAEFGARDSGKRSDSDR
jgi:hypothetical protein